MLRIAALNESSNESEEASSPSPPSATKEAQESEAFTLYNKALTLQRQGDLIKAEDVFKQLLRAPLLLEAQPPENEDANLALNPGLMLKYSTYKNLGGMAANGGNNNAAMEAYLEAALLDSSDVTLWFKIGTTALKIHHIPLARHGFEQALECNPNHWPSLDQICTVLYAVNDYTNCLYYISKALEKDCGYTKGLALREKMFSEQPSLERDTAHMFQCCDHSIYTTKVDTGESLTYISEALAMRQMKQQMAKQPELPILSFVTPLTHFKWKSLGECLIALYDDIQKSDMPVKIGCRIDLSTYAGMSPSADIPVPMETSSSTATDPGPQQQTSECVNVGDPPSVTTPVTAPVPIPVTTLVITSVTAPVVSQAAESVTLVTSEASIPTILSEKADIPKVGDGGESQQSKRGRKRKGTLLEDDFSVKRRSARVRNTNKKKEEESINYQELLQSFLPSSLLKVQEEEEDGDEKSSIEEQPQTAVDDSGTTLEGRSRLLSDTVFLNSQENEDVHELLAKSQQNGGILELMNKYLICLSERAHLKWDEGLADIYLEVYFRYRHHFVYPSFMCKDVTDKRISEMALMCLVWAEFKLDKWISSKSVGSSPMKNVALGPNFPGKFFNQDLSYLIGLSAFHDIMGDLWQEYCVRVYWLKARYLMLQTEMDLAVDFFHRASDYLCCGEDMGAAQITVKLVNCRMDNVITKDNVDKQLESLQRCQSLEEVQKLYEKGSYDRVVDLLLQTFTQGKEKVQGPVVAERHLQLLLLLDSLIKLKDFKRCVLWGEVSLNEAFQQYFTIANSSVKEEWATTMTQLFKSLDLCLSKNVTTLVSLPSKNLVRLTQNLIRVIEINMDASDSVPEMPINTVLPWKLLYRMIEHEEKKLKSMSVEPEEDKGAMDDCMPSSLMLLNIAHEYLGRKGWCTKSDGGLLLFTIDVMSGRLKQSISDTPHSYKEELDQAIEQCFYCLYGHPNKRTKAKHLQDHNAPQVTLNWDRAIVLFDYFKPKTMPEFDSYRTSTVSAELEHLLRRISLLVPQQQNQVVTIDSLTAYIDGTSNQVPVISEDKMKEMPVVKEIYYLLADYYFKNKEQGKAIKFYMHDICVCPSRFDSWAGMALARMSRLEQKLNSCELKNEGPIHKHAISALRCFKRSCELDDSNAKLWVEYGSLAYQLHSHASRQLKQHHTHPLNDEALQIAESSNIEMLRIAQDCYTNASQCEAEDSEEELWLHHYMLGKVAEKMSKPLKDYLEHYKQAAKFLHEDKARYPKKINYIVSPPHLAVEALEVFYRIHASMLKFLDRQSSEVDYDTLSKYITEANESPFAKAQEKKTERKDSSRESTSGISEDETSNSNLQPMILASSKSKRSIHVTPLDHNYSRQRSQTESEMSADDTSRDIYSSESTNIDNNTKNMTDKSNQGQRADPVQTCASITVVQGSETFSHPAKTYTDEMGDKGQKDPEEPKVNTDEMTAEGQKALESPKALDSPLLVEAMSTVQQQADKDSVPSSEEGKPAETAEPKENTLDAKKQMADNSTKYNEEKIVSGEKNGDNMTNIDMNDPSLVQTIELEIAVDTHGDAKLTVKEYMEPVELALVEMDSAKSEEIEDDKMKDPPDSVSVSNAGNKANDSKDQGILGPSTSGEVVTAGTPRDSDCKDDHRKTDGEEPMEVDLEKNEISTQKTSKELSETDMKGNVFSVSTESITDPMKDTVVGSDQAALESKDVEKVPSPDGTVSVSVKMAQSGNDTEIQKTVSPSSTDVDSMNSSRDKDSEAAKPEISEKRDDKTEIKFKEEKEEVKEGQGIMDRDDDLEILEELDEVTGMLVKKFIKAGNEVKKESLETEQTSEPMEIGETDNKTGEKKKEAEKENEGTSDKDQHRGTCDKKENSGKDKETKSSIPSDPRHRELMSACMQGLHLCLSRFPQHYKSLYRLAHIYYTSPLFKDLSKTRDLLLGPNGRWEQLEHLPCQGLFQERKQTNFFNGIWRIPIEEIDRSGSFASHMFHSIVLLVNVLKDLQDAETLFYLSQQLHRTPDSQKKYLRDTERVHLAKTAYGYCLDAYMEQVPRHSVQDPANSEEDAVRFILVIHRVYQYGLRQLVSNIEKAGKLLAKVYKVCGSQKIEEGQDPLQQAIKFCAQQLASKPSQTSGGIQSPARNTESTSYHKPETPGRSKRELAFNFGNGGATAEKESPLVIKHEKGSDQEEPMDLSQPVNKATTTTTTETQRPQTPPSPLSNLKQAIKTLAQPPTRSPSRPLSSQTIRPASHHPLNMSALQGKNKSPKSTGAGAGKPDAEEILGSGTLTTVSTAQVVVSNPATKQVEGMAKTTGIASKSVEGMTKKTAISSAENVVRMSSTKVTEPEALVKLPEADKQHKTLMISQSSTAFAGLSHPSGSGNKKEVSVSSVDYGHVSASKPYIQEVRMVVPSVAERTRTNEGFNQSLHHLITRALLTEPEAVSSNQQHAQGLQERSRSSPQAQLVQPTRPVPVASTPSTLKPGSIKLGSTASSSGSMKPVSLTSTTGSIKPASTTSMSGSIKPVSANESSGFTNPVSATGILSSIKPVSVTSIPGHIHHKAPRQAIQSTEPEVITLSSSDSEN